MSRSYVRRGIPNLAEPMTTMDSRSGTIFAGREGQRPEVAIAVALENQASTGGETAAPIARDVLESILRPAGNP